jgi:hypothetical protein
MLRRITNVEGIVAGDFLQGTGFAALSTRTSLTAAGFSDGGLEVAFRFPEARRSSMTGNQKCPVACEWSRTWLQLIDTNLSYGTLRGSAARPP